jgi:hypothetical protein
MFGKSFFSVILAQHDRLCAGCHPRGGKRRREHGRKRPIGAPDSYRRRHFTLAA